MRASQTFRWWIFLPVLLIFIVPAWMKLGDFLGYDLFPAPDPAPPRYSSELLGSCYYIVWWVLAVLVFLPACVLVLPFGDLFPVPMRLWIGLIAVSLLYSGVLFLLRRGYLSSRQRASDKPAIEVTK
jgi:undecaprenyl pyrophosphate phosphatase UppP